MRVMLLSHNHTVQEMLALAVRDMDGVDLFVFDEIGQAGQGKYDVMFVDDALPIYQEGLALAQRLMIPETVLLYQDKNDMHDYFDYHLKKPFLPAEIRDFVQARQERLEKKEANKNIPVESDALDTPPELPSVPETDTASDALAPLSPEPASGAEFWNDEADLSVKEPLVSHEDAPQELLEIEPDLPSEVEETPPPQPVSSPSKKSSKSAKKSKKSKSKTPAESEVLNLDEIETIKALLEEDGLEIVSEEELAEKVLGEASTPKPQKGDRHDALLKALRRMKPKKIRKLLKGAVVRIDITFPEA